MSQKVVKLKMADSSMVPNRDSCKRGLDLKAASLKAPYLLKFYGCPLLVPARESLWLEEASMAVFIVLPEKSEAAPLDATPCPPWDLMKDGTFLPSPPAAPTVAKGSRGP